MNEVTCHRCGKKLRYNENDDKEYRGITPIKMRQVVVDENNVSVPLYDMPADKRRLVKEECIKHECSTCLHI